MAHSDVWSSGRVLIAGDSRVRRLQSSKDPQLSKNVDFIFQGGILINDLVELVDINLTSEHKVLIIMWFIGDHRRVVADAKAACFTKGVVQQIYAEAELVDIIRQGGLKTAKEGLIESISAAQKQWSEKGLAKLNAPHPDARLVQKDIVELLPTENSEEEDSDLL